MPPVTVDFTDLRMVCPHCRHELLINGNIQFTAPTAAAHVTEFEDRTAFRRPFEQTLIADAARAVEQFDPDELERFAAEHARKEENGRMKVTQHVEKKGVQFDVTVQSLDTQAHKMLTALSQEDYDELRLALYAATMKVITRYVSKEV